MNIKQIWANKGFRNVIIKTIIFLTIFIGIQVFIRIFLRNTILFNTYLSIPAVFSLEVPNMRTIIINACLFGLVSFIILSFKKLIKIKDFDFKKHQIAFLILSIFFLVGQYLFKFMINQNTDFFLQNTLFWGIIKILINVLFVISLALGIFGLHFVKYMFKDYKKEIILFVVLSVAFFILMLLVQNLWTVFSGIISKMLFIIFSLFFDNVTYKPYVVSFTMVEGGGPLLGINNFKAIIGKPCSGIDSFLLFTSLYALIFILDYKRLKKGLTIALFFVGVIGMFLTNAFRIMALFIVGAYVDPKFAIGLFHTNVGWIFFIIYFFIYWSIVSRFMYKKKAN
jgi:exosortase/archaeosortase family protein